MNGVSCAGTVSGLVEFVRKIVVYIKDVKVALKRKKYLIVALV